MTLLYENEMEAIKMVHFLTSNRYDFSIQFNKNTWFIRIED